MDNFSAKLGIGGLNKMEDAHNIIVHESSLRLKVANDCTRFLSILSFCEISWMNKRNKANLKTSMSTVKHSFINL